MPDFTLHNVAIRALHLLDPRIETSNFRKKILALVMAVARAQYEADPEDNNEDWTLEKHINSYHCISLLQNEFKDVPDAFVIDKEREEILIFEVEDFHPMPAMKAWRLVDLADSISFEIGWDVRVFVSDRYANLTELDIEVLQAAMIHELGAIQEASEKGLRRKNDFAWHPRCMGIRHRCRKCGKLVEGDELYEHRYNCTDKKNDVQQPHPADGE